jgi:putative phage-type endonuclease
MDTADLFPAAEFTGVTSEDREAWLAMRRTMLTASSTAALFGKHPFLTVLELYAEKVTARPAQEVITIADPRFWGLALEQAILANVAKYYGWQVRAGGMLLRSRKHPHLGATLDGAVNPGPGWVPYEGKTTAAWRAKDWNEETGDVPTHVIIQAQHQLLVTGEEHIVVFCLVGGNKPVKIDLEADIAFHGAIIEESERFMEMVRTLDPPPPTGSERDAEALDRLYPKEDGSIARLSNEAVEWTRQYMAAGETKRTAERRQKHFQQLIKHAMGKATYGVLPEPVNGKACWRWATQPRAAYEVEAGEARQLIALKLPPEGARPVLALPEAKDSFLATLEESVARQELPQIGKIRFGTTRKRRTR